MTTDRLRIIYAFVSALKREERLCVEQRYRSMCRETGGRAFLLTSRPGVPNTTLMRRVPNGAMLGMSGARHASRGAKRSFLEWTVQTNLPFDHVWHIEEDAIVSPKRLQAYGSEYDVVAPLFLANPVYTRGCPLCRETNSSLSFGWPVIRLSRRFLERLYEEALATQGHHEVLSFAVCKKIACRYTRLRDARIRLARSRREHDRLVLNETASAASAFHPFKCRHEPTTKTQTHPRYTGQWHDARA